MCIQLVLHHQDLPRLRVLDIRECFPLGRLVQGGALVCDREVTTRRSGCKHHQQMAHPMALLLIGKSLRLSRFQGHREARFLPLLPVAFLETDHRIIRVIRARIDFQRLFPGGHKFGIGFRRHHPALFQPGLQLVSFSV
jgi:hypothetical protein